MAKFTVVYRVIETIEAENYEHAWKIARERNINDIEHDVFSPSNIEEYEEVL